MSVANGLKKVIRSLIPPVVLTTRNTYKQFLNYQFEAELRRSQNADALTISIAGDWGACDEAGILFQSLYKAIRAETKLSADILGIEGMSGRKYRILINEIIATLASPRYLEIGSWTGSTACSAMYGNRVEVTCIDNWVEFGGPKGEFLANVKLAQDPSTDLRLIESDFRQVDFSEIGRHNAYFFDGPHVERDHYDGIRLVQSALEDIFVLVVDDWNWLPVRLGTLRGLADERLKHLFSVEIRSTQDNSHPSRSGRESDWHNGYYLCVCQKTG